MRRLGWMLALAACTPTEYMSTTASPMLSTGEISSTGDGSGIQTVTGSDNTTVATDATNSGSGSDTDGTTGGQTTAGPSTDPGTSTTSPVGECGNGVVEGDESCDDGDDDDLDECTHLCRPPGCGDGVVHAGEDCDDANANNDDGCTQGCRFPACGDSYVQTGEECDDGNTDEDDACLNSCAAASCGDGLVQAGVETCDDGFNDNSYNGCSPGCGDWGPRCGDGEIFKIDVNKPKGFEYCDGSPPYTGVGCTGECRYDFSQVTQMYCAGNCSWGGVSGCDQADADVFCRLRTGNPNAKATEFSLGVPTDLGGFPCSNPAQPVMLDGMDPRIFLGPLTDYGVSKDVYYQLTKIKTSHGGNATSTILGGTLKCSG